MPNIQYFLGANSPRGFYSLYDQLIPVETASAIYILKGGAGCGKSTLMRKVAQTAEDAGIGVEYILCSGDPASLDAVILPALGVALVDGTAPHVVEPKCPGAVEHYVNLASCYDTIALSPLRRELMACMADYKDCYQRAYRCLGAAAQIAEDMRSTLLTSALEAKMQKRAAGILSREVHRRKNQLPGQITQRFLSAITHTGPQFLFETAKTQCRRIYELADSFGLAHTMLSHLLAGFTAAGYDVVACLSPMAPERLEHLLIPQLELAFLSTPASPLPERPYRRIRLDAMAGPELLRRSRPRLRFSKKVTASLVDEAVSSLARAKSMHDDLEALYNPHVDFGQVDRMAQEIITDILERKRCRSE